MAFKIFSLSKDPLPPITLHSCVTLFDVEVAAEKVYPIAASLAHIVSVSDPRLTTGGSSTVMVT